MDFLEVTVNPARWLFLSVAALILLIVSLCIPACAQEAPQIQVAQLQHQLPPDPIEEDTRRKFEHDQQKKASEERFHKIKEDTEKLVQLSNELKEYVGKANEHTLSLDVVKKAEEIERLAKSVKDKMKS